MEIGRRKASQSVTLASVLQCHLSSMSKMQACKKKYVDTETGLPTNITKLGIGSSPRHRKSDMSLMLAPKEEVDRGPRQHGGRTYL